jgi:hypothetical protein
MPRHLDRQEGGAESQESILGDGVPMNGVEYQAGRRAHMREQNAARQGAEWHLAHPPIVRGNGDYHVLVAERVGEVRAELALINAEHQTWLVAQAANL